MRSTALAAVGLALCSALFFTFTYVLNRSFVAGGGHWAWAGVLRYLMTLPLLAIVLPFQGGLGDLPRELRTFPRQWLVWSSVGFVLFGVPLTWAAGSGPSWLIAGSFQTTVLAGPLMAPLIYRDERAHLAWRSLAIGGLIVAGVFALQWGHAGGHLSVGDWLAVSAVVVSAFAYPLGNRMLLLHLEKTGTTLTALQRVFGMTLCSWPLWLVLAGVTWWCVGPPGWREVMLAGGVALSSGVIATVLFFRATDMVRSEPTSLAAVEAMQAAELLFATLMGVVLLGESRPHGFAAIGAVLIVVGIALFGWMSGRSAAGHAREVRAMRTDRGA
ncbi:MULTISPECIES: multidrug resistance efflux transporter family protein [Dyella]|uniref:Multidrug resistance efflux transporter family protein n=2 Tax=Dyella TaxID=231454 RepID=A0A4R0Z2S6_9GAMM|nr:MULTISPECIES: multidrug resistance efflux transporter family protein [Dyella]TBR38913.1 multidrug resistance efflux transporter family protein [Dyella terrae]TCI13496.1 multidrug resistance efflux transporter family protein [Dyella soli]